MILNTILMATSSVLAPTPGLAMPDVMAIKVAKAETVSDGTIHNAVILVKDGKIAVVGEDLPIERGIRVVDLGPDSVAIPGLVNAYSRQGMDSRGSNDSQPQQLASDELYPGYIYYPEILDAGVTTLGLYPAGNGIPGRAVAIRPHGKDKAEMIVQDDVYLKMLLRSNSSSKKMITDGFEKADEYIEKETKAHEKWEKAKEKAEKDKKKKKDDDKKVAEVGPYVPPVPDAKAKAFQQLRDRELRALISIGSAGDYLHLIDAIDDEDFDWDLRIPVNRSLNIFYVKRELGELGCRVVMEPSLSMHPNTRRLRNLPMELSEAGAKLVLIPRSDSLSNHQSWLKDTGELIKAGLPRDVALRALTHEPAEILGLGERLGSLSAGKDANILFFKSDPFEPGTEIEAVMLEGKIVSGEVN
jgi:hypothetical protein